MKKIRTLYSLKDWITDKNHLHYAAQKVLSNGGCGGVDNVSIEEFRENYKMNMRELHRQLRENRYKPHPVLRTYISKGNGERRPLGIPVIKDRIAQQAVKQILEKHFEKVFCDCSYGFRPNRSTYDAIEKLEQYKEQGYNWVLDIIRSWLTIGVMTEEGREETKEGTPQGGVISPLLANIYLHYFDKKMTRRGYKLVRFADNFIILAKSQVKAKRALEVTRQIIENELNLKLHPRKTVVTNFYDGFKFLGFKFYYYYYKSPRERAVTKFKDKVRNITRRNRPLGVRVMIGELNLLIRGWGHSFKIGDVKTLYKRLDRWIRMRVRSFIEKKKAVMHQNYRLSNKFLREKGLNSLLTDVLNYELLSDIIMISLLIYMRCGLRSDMYLCYLMVLGYAAISKRLRVIIILSAVTLFSYSVVTILETVPQFFSFGRLIIRLISIIIIITIFTDVNRKLTAEKMTRKKAAEMALIDSLTGVYSRSMIKYIADYYDDQTENKYIAMLDIDEFKQVNDKYGHQFGDQVLKVLGQIILEAIAEEDICIRCRGEKLTVTISGGLTVFKEKESIEEAISRADAALYKAKETGKK